MDRLHCSARNCIHNYNNICTADYIVVNTRDKYSQYNTKCDTFSKKGLRDILNNIQSTNLLDYYEHAFSINTNGTYISCNVKECIYNKNNICTASNIQMYGKAAYAKEGTFCKTFTK